MSSMTTTTTVTAQPYEARQCPECKVWVYTAAGPFAEGDPTKTEADWLHWEENHADVMDASKPVVGFPYFPHNEVVVEAQQASFEGRDIDLDNLVVLLQQRHHVFAYVEQTGGGVATLYAGPSYKDTDGDLRFAAAAGPGWFAGPGFTQGQASREEFYISADGEDAGGVDDWVSPTEGQPEQEIAELIYVQVLKTCALLHKQSLYRAANPLEVQS